MKITSVRDTLKQTKTFDGLVKCEFEYSIKSATAKLDYTGPTIPPEVWHQVLSFFKWTYDTTKSESQVRMYVNPRLGRWGAWAFPQKARTGMTSLELDIKETPEKARERFASWDSSPSDEWLYFSTVHHHCECDAFQSSTDEANERGQDGLHITIGKMASKQHNMHARFYLNGASFEPDMSLFWYIDPPGLLKLVPEECWDLIARHQMTIPSDEPFPDQWKENLIEEKIERVTTPGCYGFNGGQTGSYDPRPWTSKETPSSRPWHERVQAAAREFINETIRDGFKLEDAMEIVEEVDQNIFYAILESAADSNKVSASDAARALIRWTENDAMALEHEMRVPKDEATDPGPEVPKHEGSGKKPKTSKKQ